MVPSLMALRLLTANSPPGLLTSMVPLLVRLPLLPVPLAEAATVPPLMASMVPLLVTVAVLSVPLAEAVTLPAVVPLLVMVPLLVTVAVLPVPPVTLAVLLSPVTVAVLLVPVTVAVLLVPLTRATSPSPATVALLPAPMAIALEPVPVAVEVAVPCCTRVAPLVDTLRFCPGALEPDDEEEPESDGLADATHGVAASPAPMPNATANAPTRPTYLAYPIVVALSCDCSDEAEFTPASATSHRIRKNK